MATTPKIMDNKEKLARLILATTEVADSDTPTVPAGLAARTAAVAADLPVVRRILTPAYTVAPSKELTAIRCTSRNGMRLLNGDDDDAAFESAMTAFRQHFGARLLEVSENVCTYHQDFTIYLAPSL
jgi:hypothetical protein